MRSAGRLPDSLLALLSGGTWAFSRSLVHKAGDAYTVAGTCSWSPCAGAPAEGIPSADSASATDGSGSSGGGAPPPPPPPAALRYEERGRMLRGAAEFVADVKQAHTWHLRGPLRAEVFFSDGRPFHGVGFARLAAGEASRCVHQCAPDPYEGELALVEPLPGEGGPLSLEVAWRVTGPEKDYTSRTRFWRAGGGR